MAWRIDENDENAIVFEGHDAGIADSPYRGISDMRNMNIISVPDEASVNFATTKNSSPSVSGSMTSADSGTNFITVASATGLENRMAIVFSSVSGGMGISVGTNPYKTGSIYWIGDISGNTFKLYSNYGLSSLVTITGTGTGSFTTINMSKPKYFTLDTHIVTGTPINKTFMVDMLGQVWSNFYTTGTNSYFTYTGNKVPDSAYTNGNGIAYFRSSGDVGYIIVFHNSSMDIATDNTVTWNYQWTPASNSYAGYNAAPTAVLNAANTTLAIHATLVGQDNVIYFCDSQYVGSIIEVAGQQFVPTSAATYTFSNLALKLPGFETSQSLAELGVNLLVGGIYNAIYPWNRTATSFTYPILLSEYNIQQMVTVNTNTFIFVGNRGRIYITNGSQAQLYKKVPDHISGTVEPYFTWGGVMSNKNQLYFSALVTTNAGVTINQYGGLWAIDLDTKAIRLTNKLSYNTYAGYGTAMIPVTTGTPLGTGFFVGWDDGSAGYGLDTSSGSPYTGSQASVDYDLVPISSFLRPRTFKSVEFKLSCPMVSGESVSIYYRLNFSSSYTLIFTSNTAGTFSDNSPVNFENAQWIQLRAVTNSTASSPSYTRLKEIRIK